MDCYVDVHPAVHPSPSFISSDDKMLGLKDAYSTPSNYFLSANQNDSFYSNSDKVEPQEQRDLKAPSDLLTATVCHSVSMSTDNVLEPVDVCADMPAHVTGDSFHSGTSLQPIVIPSSTQETTTVHHFLPVNVVSSVVVQTPTACESDSSVPSNTFLPTNQDGTQVPLPTPSCNCLTVTTYHTKLPVELQISTRISAQLVEDSSSNIVKQEAPPWNVFASSDSKTSCVPQLIPLHHCSSVDARSGISSPIPDTSLPPSGNQEALPSATLVSSCDSKTPQQVAPVHSSTASTQVDPSLRSLQSGIKEALPTCTLVSYCDSNTPQQVVPVHSSTASTQVDPSSLRSLQSDIKEALPTCTLVSSCDSNTPQQVVPVHSRTASTQVEPSSLRSSGIKEALGQTSVSFDPDSAAYSSEPRPTPRDPKPSPESASHPNALPSRVTVSASRDVTFGSALRLHGRPLILNQYVDLSNPPLYSAVTVSGPDKPFRYCGWFSFLNIVSALMAIIVTILAVLTYYRRIRKCQ